MIITLLDLLILSIVSISLGIIAGIFIGIFLVLNYLTNNSPNA